MRDLPLYATTLVAAYALKRHYSTASADGLRFILDPTAWLASHATGRPFLFESGVGHVSIDSGFILAPECAGVNFLIIAACSLVFALAPLRPAMLGRAAFAVVCLAVAYAATLAANAVRVMALLWLEAGVELHRIVGLVVYLGSLLLLHALARGALESRCCARPSSGT